MIQNNLINTMVVLPSTSLQVIMHKCIPNFISCTCENQLTRSSFYKTKVHFQIY
jgi:hypothetical protein